MTKFIQPPNLFKTSKIDRERLSKISLEKNGCGVKKKNIIIKIINKILKNTNIVITKKP